MRHIAEAPCQCKASFPQRIFTLLSLSWKHVEIIGFRAKEVKRETRFILTNLRMTPCQTVVSSKWLGEKVLCNSDLSVVCSEHRIVIKQ